MTRLELGSDELSIAMEKAFALAKLFWETLPDRSAYHGATGEATTRLFSRAWGEDGLGAQVLDDFTAIADLSRAVQNVGITYNQRQWEPHGCPTPTTTRLMPHPARHR